MALRYPLDTINITQGWGADPAFYKQYGQNGHNGIDFGAPAGTPVYAAESGTVVYEGWGGGNGWVGKEAGIHVLIRHSGLVSNYAHLSGTVINNGQTVNKGQLIGYVGATGAAYGPHLHFEVFPLSPNFSNGFAGRIDPMPFINTTKTATADEIKKAYLEILERDADQSGLNHYSNYSIDFVRQDLLKSQEKRDLDARKATAAKEAAEKAQAEAARKAEEAKKAAEAQKALEEAQKAEQERLAAEAELERIREEERIAREAAEARAKAQAEIENKAKEALMATTQEINKLVSDVASSEEVQEITKGISKRTKTIVYIVGDSLIGIGLLLPGVSVGFGLSLTLEQVTALSTTAAMAGAFLLTMFGIYKSK